jgi:hypothetical protein
MHACLTPPPKPFCNRNCNRNCNNGEIRMNQHA